MKAFYRIKKEIGNAVLSKYDNKCVVCGSNKNLCVHHIIPMNPDNKRYNDIVNLTVLCRACHMSHHRKHGDIKIKEGTTGNPNGRRGDNPPIRCSINGCKNWQHGKGLCKKHYEYNRRRGFPIKPISNPASLLKYPLTFKADWNNIGSNRGLPGPVPQGRPNLE